MLFEAVIVDLLTYITRPEDSVDFKLSNNWAVKTLLFFNIKLQWETTELTWSN